MSASRRQGSTYRAMRTMLCLLGLIAALPVGAQSPSEGSFPVALADSLPDWTKWLDQPAGCLASIPRSDMHRVPIVLDASVDEHDDSALTFQTDLLVQDVGDRLREMLGAKGSEVPNADTMFAWYSVPTEVVLIARRNGEMLVHARNPSGDSTATTFLARAVADARAREQARMVWLGNLKPDSILIRLHLAPLQVAQGAIQSLPSAQGMRYAAFYLMVPALTPPQVLPNQPPPRYPTENEWRPYEASLILQYVVDSTGRVDSRSIRALWPAGKPRLSGYDGEAYEAFVRSARSWAARLRFEPSRIGSCPVRKVVRHPLTWNIVRQ